MNGWSSQNSGTMVQPRKAPTGPQLCTASSAAGLRAAASGSRILSISSRRVVQLDRLAAVDLLDLLAGDRVQRLDPALVQDGDLAEQIVGRTGSRRLRFFTCPSGLAGRNHAPASTNPTTRLPIRFIIASPGGRLRVIRGLKKVAGY